VSGILEDLNPEQKQAVITTEGPLLIIAGAGTGKTTVIARRIAYIIEKKLAKPAEILALTFTDKAAQEMEERVDILVPYGYIDTHISTFHAFGDQVLRDHALEIGLSPDFRILTRPEQILFFQQNLFAFDLKYFRPLSNPYKFIDAILTLISRAKDEDVTPRQYLSYVQKLKGDKDEKNRQTELAMAFEKYEKLKTEAGLLDFGDQVVKTLDLLRSRPKILGAYQNRFKYILVDEYQDTNYAQNELVKILAQKRKNICVVGDDDQAIYKFRGAAISNILEFKKNYPKTKQVVLTQNFRSTQAILDSAYKLISHNNPDRLEIRNKITKKLKSQKGKKGLPPKLLFGATLSEECDLVTKEIEKLMAKPPSSPYSSSETKGRMEKSFDPELKTEGFSTSSNNKYSYKDIAILVRANSSAEPFIQSLHAKGVPFQFIGAFGLYDRPEVKMLIAFLKALSTYSDDLNLYYLATSELYQISPEEMIKLNDLAKRRTKTLYEVIKNNLDEINIDEKSKKSLGKMLDDISTFINFSRKEDAGKVLYQYLQDSGYLKKLVLENSIKAQEEVANIARFFERISEFGRIAKQESVQNFSNFLEVMRASGENPATAQLDPDLDAVNILTVHSAKGLEFKAVFLVNLVSDRFPVRDRSEPIPLPDKLIKETLPVGDFHLQEERRLFYVGLTRAKEHLYLTYARDYGGKRERKVSPFVLETLDVAQVEGMPVKSSSLEKIERFKPAQKGQLIFDFEKRKVVTEDRVLDLSRVQIESYLSCALQYWYGHVSKLQVPRGYSLVYGIALHKAVEEFYEYKIRDRVPSLNQIIQVLEDSWVAEGFLTAEHERQLLLNARRVIGDFYRREKDKKLKGVEVEKTFRFVEDRVIVRGRIDYLETNGKVTILDFKSTQDIDEEKGTDRVKQSIQLKIYALAYQKMTGKLPDLVGLYFLDNGLISTIKPEQKFADDALNAIKVTAAGIRAANFKANPKEGAFTCKYCSYNRICPHSLV